MDIFTYIETTQKHLLRAIYEAHEGRCFYTGRFVFLDEVAIDHIYPKSKGGKNCIANYVLTSKYVNSKKMVSVDELLVERMQYINQVAYAPATLKIYNKAVFDDINRNSDEVPLKDYIAMRGIKDPPEAHTVYKVVPFVRKAREGESKIHRMYKVVDLDRFFGIVQ
jgi:HNH endonuclease